MDRSWLVLVLLLGGVGCEGRPAAQGTDRTVEVTASGATAECASGAQRGCPTQSAQNAGPATPTTPAPALTGNEPAAASPFVQSRPSVRRVSVVPADPPEPPPVVDSTLSAERSAWHAHAPAEYVLASCGSGAVAPSCGLQAVQHGAIVASETRSFDTHEWATYEGSDTEDPIDALFDELETASGDCRVTHELGPDYGYVSRIYHDCGEEGWGTNVLCFVADTLDLEACRASVH